jgi:hypothetical protein
MLLREPRWLRSSNLLPRLTRRHGESPLTLRRWSLTA